MRSQEKGKPAVSPSQQGLIFQTPEMQAILKLKQKHEKQIQQTIQVIQDLSHSKMPQKCLTHSHNYTLYCQNDQKPLCASCMYQNQLHKIHKVHPLNSCADLLKRDCDKLQRELGYIVDNMTGLVKHVNQGIMRMDKDFPHLVWKIQDCYKKLHSFLVDREKEHVNELRYFKEKMKYQHGALSAELNKISLFIEQKINQYSKRNEFQMLLTKRNIFDTLKNSAKIVGDELNIKEEEDGPKLSFEVFTEIEQFMYAKLPQLFKKVPIKKLEKKYNFNSSSKRLINSRSKEKASFSPVTREENRQEGKIKSQSKEKDKSAKKNSSKSITPQKPNRTPTKPPKTPPKRQRTKSTTKPILKNSPSKSQNSPSRGSPKKAQNSSPTRK